MTAFISRKQSLLILLAGICTAAGIVLLSGYLLAGPRLGPHYDLLNSRRQDPPIFRDILLIRTDEIIENNDVFTVLMVLGEFNASSLIIEVPVLGASSHRIQSDREIHQLLDDEYVLLGRNIRNLFEAIRIGSVQPLESQKYVDSLVELANRGRDRLSSALIGTDSVQAVLWKLRPSASLRERAAGIIGNVLEASDLRPQQTEDSAYYSRPAPDYDGILRRVAPMEHIVYKTLESHWEKSGISHRGQAEPKFSSGIELTERGNVFTADDFKFPLDAKGNILVEKPGDWNSFRSIDLDYFRKYIEEDRVMQRLLKEAEALGIFSNLEPEKIPGILYDYAQNLLDALLNEPSEQGRSDWIHAREEYFRGLDELFNSAAETNLVNAYEDLIAAEKSKPAVTARLHILRDELISSFAAMREKYLELEGYRNNLASSLDVSFCIMGPAPADSQVVEASVLLANTLMTGRCITPGSSMYITFWSMLAVFILLFVIHSMRPLAVLLLGITAGFLCAAGFGWSFIISGYWIDPLIPAVSCMSGTLVMFFSGFFIRRVSIRNFRLAYSPAVNKNCLRQLIRKGRPSLSEMHSTKAAVVAVKDMNLQAMEEEPLGSAHAIMEFRTRVSQEFKKAGATIIGCEGTQVLACFGSPLERIYLGQTKTETRYGDDSGAHGSYHPVSKAAGFITELVRNSPDSWHFGMDFGLCAFYWSAQTGYTASGRPVIRARVLSSLTSRYRARILITDTVREKINQPVRKLHVLNEAGNGTKERFYELLLGDIFSS